MLVIALALVAAACFGSAAVLEQRVAARAPVDRALRLGLIGYLVRRPLWLTGVVAEFTGDGVQAVALGLGSLAVVQPLLVTSLLFALPLGARLNRERLGRREWVGAF